MTADIIVIGAGGHAASVIEVINSTKHYRIVKLVDPKTPAAHGYSCLQDESLLKAYCKNGQIELGAIAIGSVFDWSAKLRGVDLLKSVGLVAPPIIASTAHIACNVKLGFGTVVHHHAFVNADTTVGEYCTINTGAILEHDVVVGNYCHIAPGAIILAGAMIDDYCLIGASVIVPAGKEVPSRTIWANFRDQYATVMEGISSSTKTTAGDTHIRTKSDVSSVAQPGKNGATSE